MNRQSESLSYSFNIGIWYWSNDLDLSVGQIKEPNPAGTVDYIHIYRLEAPSHQSQSVCTDRIQHYLWLL
jgi:hypothetical protein